MKINIKQLKNLIKEELESIMQEQARRAKEPEAQTAVPVQEHITKSMLKKLIKEELKR